MSEYGDGLSLIGHPVDLYNCILWFFLVHYYNYFGDMWNWETYPKPRMATEYGFQSLPSVHAWATAANEIGTDLNWNQYYINQYKCFELFTGKDDDWHYDGKLLDTRQHHPKGNDELVLQVERQLGKARETTPEQRFLDMIYLTQMHQAEAIKIESEHYRRLQVIDFDGFGYCMVRYIVFFSFDYFVIY